MDQFTKNVVDLGERVMDYLVMLIAGILIVLFGIGVFDLSRQIYLETLTGSIYNPLTIVHMIDTIILLFLIVEFFRDVIAYLKDLDILPIVIDITILAIARKLITFRAGEYGGGLNALYTSLAYTLPLGVVLVAYYFIRRQQDHT